MKTFIKLIITPLILGILLISVSCKDAKNQGGTASANSDLKGNYAVEVEMEGQVFHLQQDKLLPIKKTFTKDSILLVFRADKHPFQLNLNLTHTDILSKQKATYTIPDANAGKIKVDLNFFNADRDVKRMNKRIIFRKGTIEIEKLTENKLKLTFKGEGRGITERSENTFPISGKINATLNQ